MAFLAKTYHDFGMARDTDVAKGKDTLAYENFNIRITARDRETLLSVTNDRGNVRVVPERWLVIWNDPDGKDRTQGFTIVGAAEYNKEHEGEDGFEPQDTELHLMGTVIGYNVLNNYVTLFTTEGEGKDHIYRVEYVPGDETNEWRGLELLSGDMGFDAHKPIETLGDYENDDVLKVYWLDGVNQPRVLNISDRNITENGIGDWTKIDFVAEFSPTLKVTVEKVYEGTAVFGAGIVQYVFTYGNKYGQQSNIVYVSPVCYASPSGRGGSPEESFNCQFRITVSGFDMTWQWLNVYRVMQTSESGQWTADRVAKLSVGDGEAVYTDDGSSAESVDPAEMLYVGGREISAYTMCAKDQTLFLGNLKMLTTESDPEIMSHFAEHRGANVKLEDGISELLSFRYTDDEHCIPYSELSGYYPYECQLDYSGDVIRTFKAGEKYRIGIRFVTKAGMRTGVYWVGDVEQTLYPNMELDNGKISKACVVCAMDADFVSKLEGKGYMQAELMMAEMGVSDRSVLSQGVVLPTVFNLDRRYSDTPFAMSSWYARPRSGLIRSRMTARHYEPIPKNDSMSAEIQCINEEVTPYDTTSNVSDEYVYRIWDLRAKRQKSTTMLVHGYLTVSYVRRSESDSGMRYEIAETILSCEIKRNYDREGHFANDVINELKKVGLEDVVQKDTIEHFVNHFESGGPYSYSNRKDFHTSILEYIYHYTESKSDPYWKWEPSVDELVQYAGVSVGRYGSYMGARYVSMHHNSFFVDENVCTFHTPELYDGFESMFENTQCRLRVIGAAFVTANITDYTLDVGNFTDSNCGQADFNLSTPNRSDDPSGLLTFPLYNGSVFNALTDDETICSAVMNSGMWTYPWHKTGSMTFRSQGDTDDSGSLVEMAVRGEDKDVLNSKTESNMRFCLWTDYMWATRPWSPSGGIYPLKVYNSDEDALKQIVTCFEEVTYQGNYDVLLGCRMNNVYKDGKCTYESEYDDGYRLFDTYAMSTDNSIEDIYASAFSSDEENGDRSNEKGYIYRKEYCNKFYDPVDITVKSTEHVVVAFCNSPDGSMVFLPNIYVGGEKDNDYSDVVETPVDPEGGEVFLPWHYESTDVSDYDKYVLFPRVEGELKFYWFVGEYDGGKFGFDVSEDDWDVMLAEIDVGVAILTPADSAMESFVALRYNGGFSYEPTSVPAPWGVALSLVSGPDGTGGFRLGVECMCAEGCSSVVVRLNGVETTLPVEGGEIDVSGLEEGVRYEVFLKASTDDVVRHCDSEYVQYGTVMIEGEPDGYTVDVENEWSGAESEMTDLRVVLDVEEIEGKAYLSGGGYDFLFEDGKLGSLSVTGFSYSENDYLVVESEEDLPRPYFFVAELYNDFSTNDSRYGGTTDYAVQNNTFIPLGNVTPLDKMTEIVGYAGDTYFQRWDCQKTRKYSDGSENNINEFFSVMLETRRNIEGRYDIRRGLLNNQATTPENSNLFNGAYDNLGTLFSGNVLDERYSLDEYPAQLTWTLDKTPGAETDPWTNVTLASVLDMDGSKGPLEALRTHANAIFAFQDRGIAEVLFNTRTQLATTEGVPVEIANSGRVDGKRYVTERNGCRDKWSIGVTKGGLWFADWMNGTINRVSQQVEDVSTQKGMSVWARARCCTGIWDPVDYGAFAAFADTTRDEVYFCRPLEGDALDALCFSEILGEFTSFHGYGRLSAMFNVADRLLAFRDAGDGESGMWLQGEGRHGEFFGEPQDFYVQFRAAPDPYGDKTFTNLEYRADVFDMSEPNPYMEGEGRLTGRTFDSLRVWDEYQGNEVALGFDALRDAYPDTRRLNRIWRTDIPRARRGDDNPFGLNRIRNPWVWLRLTGTTPEEGDYMMSFHDLTVKYVE